MTQRIAPSDTPEAQLLHRAAESLLQGNRQAGPELRGPLAQWLKDAATGDEWGVVSPYAVVVARAVLDERANS